MSHTRDAGLPDLAGIGVLVTGGAGGVGSGIVRRFAAAGARVLIHFRSSPEPAEALAAEIRAAGGHAITAGADLREPGAADALVATAVASLGRLDALVNNAGIQPVAPLAELSPGDWTEMLGTNLVATAELSRAVAAHLGEHGGGSITHIASVEASRPAIGHAHYSAAKAAVVMHARAAALELGPRGIRVNSVSPGLIDAGGLAEAWPEGHASWLAAAPLGRTGSPVDIGNACVFLASPAASFITGHDLVVDGGMLATPGW